MPDAAVEIGKGYGRLTVVAEAPPVVRSYPGRPVHRTRRVLCICECGRHSEVDLGHARHGRVGSCGCIKSEMVSEKMRTHGETVQSRSAEYNCWKAMIQRCENPKRSDFRLYGARGISICDRWRTGFENFLADMGRKPSPKHSIDRINNDGNYEPGNCRWATAKEQRHNQRRPNRMGRPC